MKTAYLFQACYSASQDLFQSLESSVAHILKYPSCVVRYTLNIPSEHATSAQRLPNVFQTSMTFEQRWVDVTTLRVHGHYNKNIV